MDAAGRIKSVSQSSAASPPGEAPARPHRGNGRLAAARDGASGLLRPAARQETLRESNLSLVTEAIFGAVEPPSRATIAALTGMTRSTASRLVDDLLAAGIVREGEPVFAGSRGRPAVPLLPARGTLAGLGVEIDIGFMAARVLDLTGDTLAEEVLEGDFRDSDPADVLPRAGAMARRVAAHAAAQGASLVGTCIGLPGLIDPHADRLLVAPNLGWRDVDVAGLMGDTPGEFVVIANEAKLAALTVARDLAASEGQEQSFIYVSAHMGIGAAVVIDGLVSAGPRGWAGEIGHMCVEPTGPRCGCGATGCLEVFAGKRALRAALELDSMSPVSDVLERSEQADADGERAREALQRAASALGIALSDAVNLLDVDQIILGGEFAPLTQLLRPGIEAQLRERVLASEFGQQRVRAASGDGVPAAGGGALRALRTVISNPMHWVPEAMA
ncbi:MAG TPA: ROK family protein [Candidatus Nesterenkonia stercoripullorum]|uniref:ROK family protein n=1 Tax=Candidatus Nesterenkonia stercoripullorum TaxID=2838701 RepID=A0A9D1UV05_9MICC|nr:ROK family protein [Candidatus Nesterenkonia stercoripullorum]